jgi:hypothetical protein
MRKNLRASLCSPPVRRTFIESRKDHGLGWSLRYLRVSRVSQEGLCGFYQLATILGILGKIP